MSHPGCKMSSISQMRDVVSCTTKRWKNDAAFLNLLRFLELLCHCMPVCYCMFISILASQSHAKVEKCRTPGGGVYTGLGVRHVGFSSGLFVSKTFYNPEISKTRCHTHATTIKSIIPGLQTHPKFPDQRSKGELVSPSFSGSISEEL